jgi:hypothetical protein
LAAGADQLFARIICDNRLDLIAVIPCNRYDETFQKEADLAEYMKCRNNALSTVQLNFEEPSETAFFEAGILLVDKSDIIFCIWDEKPAKGSGGTGDIVAYAKALKKKIIHLNPITLITKQY